MDISYSGPFPSNVFKGDEREEREGTRSISPMSSMMEYNGPIRKIMLILRIGPY